jgi:hypothetical protein
MLDLKPDELRDLMPGVQKAGMDWGNRLQTQPEQRT